MEPVSLSMEALSLNESKGLVACTTTTTTTTSNPGGHEYLNKDESNNITMGKGEAPSPDVAVVLQAPDVTPSSLCSLYDRLNSRMTAIRRVVAESRRTLLSAREGLLTVRNDIKTIASWFRKQRERALKPPEEAAAFRAKQQKLLKAVKDLEGRIDIASIFQSINISIPLMIIACDSILFRALSSQSEFVESKLYIDNAYESLEVLVVDVQAVLAWFESQQNADDHPEDGTDMRSSFAKLLSEALALRPNIAKAKCLLDGIGHKIVPIVRRSKRYKAFYQKLNDVDEVRSSTGCDL